MLSYIILKKTLNIKKNIEMAGGKLCFCNKGTYIEPISKPNLDETNTEANLIEPEEEFNLVKLLF